MWISLFSALNNFPTIEKLLCLSWQGLLDHFPQVMSFLKRGQLPGDNEKKPRSILVAYFILPVNLAFHFSHGNQLIISQIFLLATNLTGPCCI
jgi:hypothetical protein